MPRIVVCSEFFHNPELWMHLENTYLPKLIKQQRGLRVLSAGCGTGKEPFSVAILLDQLSPERTHEILAVDHNPSVLNKAAAGGPFSERDLRWIEPPLLATYFEQRADSFYVRPRLLEKARFALLDLLRDEIPGQIDLLLFRDLETCFAPENTRLLYRKFHAALRTGGLLFVGALDHVPAESMEGFRRLDCSYYLKDKLCPAIGLSNDGG